MIEKNEYMSFWLARLLFVPALAIAFAVVSCSKQGSQEAAFTAYIIIALAAWAGNRTFGVSLLRYGANRWVYLFSKDGFIVNCGHKTIFDVKWHDIQMYNGILSNIKTTTLATFNPLYLPLDSKFTFENLNQLSGNVLEERRMKKFMGLWVDRDTRNNYKNK
jgi:hypothetical protein